MIRQPDFQLTLLLAACIAASGALAQTPDPVAVRAGEATPAVPKLVFALYYPWYGLKAVSGTDRHVGAVDPIRRTVSDYAQYPLSGPYDSSDPATIARQMSEMKQAGIDVVAVSWFGASDPSAGAARALMPLAQAAGLKVCLVLEHLERVKLKGDFSTAVGEVADLVKEFFPQPAYLSVSGKPVFFLHSDTMDQLGNPSWATALLQLERAVPPGVVLVGDINEGVQPSDALVYDGLHYNDPALYIASYCQQVPRALMRHEMRANFHLGLSATSAAAARSHSRIVVATVSPGFDDVKSSSPPVYHLSASREGGQFYMDSWEAALAQSPDWVLVQSYNQWEEGTEIEPSFEFRDQYLQLTRQYADRFRSGAAAPAIAPRLRATPGGPTGTAAAGAGAKASSPPRLRPVKARRTPKKLAGKKPAPLTSGSSR